MRFEAEQGQLAAPMAVSTDIQAFGRLAISSSVADTGTAAWTFNAPTSGPYVIWCRVLAADASHDSFYVRMDGGPEDIYDAAEGTWSPRWQWTRVNGRNGTGIPLTLNPRIFVLSAGAHSLSFRGREPGTMLDRLIVTSDQAFVPTEGNTQTFLDVPPSNPFYPFVETLARDQIAGGCGGGDYCPDSMVTRAQMAVLLLRSEHGAAYVPPPATGTVFADVPASSFAAAWIEQLAAEKVATGCGGGNFCPGDPVTRAQAAVFLLRAEHGAAYTPPPATGLFLDVPVSNPFAPWIEQLVREGITAGCGAGTYCPQSAVTRGQLAVFLVETFALP